MSGSYMSESSAQHTSRSPWPSSQGIALAVLLPLLFALCALRLPTNLMISGTGFLAALMLLVVLAANTFSSVWPHASAERFLIRRRELFVLSAISFTLLHVFIQLFAYSDDGALMDIDVLSGWIVFGGLCVTLLLGVLRHLHLIRLQAWMLLYPLAGFMLFHWYHGTGSPQWLIVYVVALVVLEGIRIVHHLREDYFKDYRPSN